MHSFTFRERLASAFNLLPSAIYDSFPAVLFGRSLVLAIKLGIFESLDGHPATAKELAGSIGLHFKSAELILPALATAGYLKQQRETYSLAPQAKKWLVSSSPHYIGNFLAYIGVLYKHWNYLEESMKNGKPPVTYIDSFSADEWRIYTLGMMDLAKLILPQLVPKIQVPPGATKILDVCGSHGLYSIELCSRYPAIRSTIVDLPEVLKTTRTIIAERHLEDRIILLAGDVTTMQFTPNDYDLALAFNIIHGFSAELNSSLLHSIGSALKSNGRLYILDQINNDRSSGAHRMIPLMVGLNLLNEIGGTIYRFEEIESWCAAAGLSTVRHRRLSIPGVSLIHATKN